MPPVSKRRKLSNGEYESLSPSPDDHVVTSTTTDPAPQPTKADQRRSLFVRSLPASVTTESLTEHFSQSFPLKHATVVLDPTTKISRGFGFVTFIDAEDAQAAVEKFNNSVLDNRKIKVEIAESRNREIEEDITGTRKGTKNLKGEELRTQRKQKLDENQPPKLIVRNLPWSVKTSDDLTKLFMSYGKVKHAVVPKGKNGQLAGFGFVVLRGKKNAEKALEGVNGKEIDGRTLAVDWAVDKDAWNKIQDEETQADGNDGKGELEAALGSTAEEDATKVEGEEDEQTSSEGEEQSDEEEAIMNGALLSDKDAMSDISEGDAGMTKTVADQNSTTVFIRNLPFSVDDESLKAHFKEHFGAVRYARVVYDHETERSRGTGFVCFFNESDAKECVKSAPKRELLSGSAPQNSYDRNDKQRRGETSTHSVLQNEAADPSGRYTIEGRVLQASRTLTKEDADRRMQESSVKRDHDRRRLYLLSEGTIPKGSHLYNSLGKAEIDIRESSARQRQRLVKTNPNLCLSLTRLSIRNIPRSVSSKDLKALAREAVVGFARDMRDGKRQSLSKEELTRGGDADRDADRERKAKGKGIVKQVKIVFESDKTGSKVGEGKGGRSRGYGFIEYYGHRNALMGLRWLNGHLVKVAAAASDAGGQDGERGKRLIVEFAIENAQVIQRRQDRERRFQSQTEGDAKEPQQNGNRDRTSSGFDSGSGRAQVPRGARKRKFDDEGKPQQNKRGAHAHRETRNKTQSKGVSTDTTKAPLNEDEKNKLAMRNRIISEKRRKRRTRKGKA